MCVQVSSEFSMFTIEIDIFCVALGFTTKRHAIGPAQDAVS